MKIVYQCDALGHFTGRTTADESPLETGVLLIPAGATEIPPPEFQEGQRAVFDGSEWRVESINTPHSPPTLDEVKASRLLEINTQCSRMLTAVIAGVPSDEVQSWPKQEAEARAYAANPVAVAPLITALSLARGVPLPDLVTRIIAKADAFASASGQIIGNRQRCEDQIEAATTAEAVAAVVW